MATFSPCPHTTFLLYTGAEKEFPVSLLLVRTPVPSDGAPNFLPSFTLVLVCQVTQSCPTLCEPMDYNPPGSSVHGILQARILEWAAMPSSRESSWPRDRTHISCGSCTAGRFFTAEPPGKAHLTLIIYLKARSWDTVTLGVRTSTYEWGGGERHSNSKSDF